MKYSFTLKILSILLLIGLAFGCSTEEDSMPENNLNNSTSDNSSNSTESSSDSSSNSTESSSNQTEISFNSELLCNTPMYSDTPPPNNEEGDYEYYSYLWQTDEGKRLICLNSYEGVSEESNQLINEVLLAASERLGQLLPINITAYYYGISNLEVVMSKWDELKMTNGGFDPGEFTAAAGVDIENIHNGGQGEISQGVFEDLERGRKIIYHEFFHIHQNSHKLFFEESNNFGWNRSRIQDGRDNLDYVDLVGPNWIEEGGAEFAAIYLSSENDWINFNQAMTEYLDEARSLISDAASRNDIVSLQDYESPKNIGLLESSENPTGVSRQYAYHYSGGTLAHLYLLRTQRASLNNMIIDYYKDLAELERDHLGEGYLFSFEQNFGISLDDFYLEFDDFMLLPREEQLSILQLN